MGQVGGVGSQHDLAVAGHLQLARLGIVIRERDAANLDGVFGRDNDFQKGLDIAIATAEGSPVRGED